MERPVRAIRTFRAELRDDVDGEGVDPRGLKAAISAFTRRYCERVLEAADGNLEAAAAAARYTPRGFLLLLERLRLDDRVK